MAKSISKNSIFYLFYNVLNVIFPFISSMYVARVLLPESIGEVAYAQNIVQYFVIFSFLGIPTYALREISKDRDDKEALNKVYSELMIINFISTIFFSIIYTVLVFTNFENKKTLYFTVGLSIILNVFNNSWLFESLEEFQYISIRNFIFKIVVFLGIIILVKNENDYLIYAIMSVLGTVGNYFFNIVYSKKFVKIQFNGLNFKRHLKPIMYLVCVNLAIEIYTLVDTTMLGMMCSKEHVAYYTYGSRINKIFIQVINTFTIVLVPRLSYYYKEKRMNEFSELLTRTVKIILILSFPLIIGIQFVGTCLVCTLFGADYYNSAVVLRILSIVVLVSPIGYLLGSRVMLVSNRENKMFFCVLVGAIVNLLGNYYLIPRYAENGAALASVMSEIVVMIIYVYRGRNVYKLRPIANDIVKILIGCLIEFLWLFICHELTENTLLCAVVQVCGSIIAYFTVLVVLREDVVLTYLGRIREKCNAKR